MPRRYKEDPRTFFKTFRFTAAEITRLENRARARRQSLSQYVRSALFSKDGDEDGEAQPGATPAYPRNQTAGLAGRGNYAMQVIIDQLRRIGTNLNQIARRMNDRRTPPPRDLTLTIDEIRALVRQAREL